MESMTAWAYQQVAVVHPLEVGVLNRRTSTPLHLPGGSLHSHADPCPESEPHLGALPPCQQHDLLAGTDLYSQPSLGLVTILGLTSQAAHVGMTSQLAVALALLVTCSLPQQNM